MLVLEINSKRIDYEQAHDYDPEEEAPNDLFKRALRRFAAFL